MMEQTKDLTLVLSPLLPEIFTCPVAVGSQRAVDHQCEVLAELRQLGDKARDESNTALTDRRQRGLQEVEGCKARVHAFSE